MYKRLVEHEASFTSVCQVFTPTSQQDDDDSQDELDNPILYDRQDVHDAEMDTEVDESALLTN